MWFGAGWISFRLLGGDQFFFRGQIKSTMKAAVQKKKKTSHLGLFASHCEQHVISQSVCWWQKWKWAATQSSWWSWAEGAARGLDQSAGLLLILTALPHGHANAAAATGLPSGVCCVRFIQFRGDKWVRLLCTCVKGEDINYILW